MENFNSFFFLYKVKNLTRRTNSERNIFPFNLKKKKTESKVFFFKAKHLEQICK